MNLINKFFFIRQFNNLGKSYRSNIQNINSKKVYCSFLRINSKTKISLFHNSKIISKFKSKNSFLKNPVGCWLLTCSGMVFVAVALGGITRLTESGLSMVTWKLCGEKIPFNELSWLNEFDKYKKFPEFKMINKNITLEDFKQIWFMEYIHRMWGRLIGIIFIIPASYFWIKKMLKSGMKKKILLLGTMIGCQGFLGWYMVKSGLENEFKSPSEIPRVSQYRLAAHLGLAIIIYSIFLDSALDHLYPSKNSKINISGFKSVDQNLMMFKRLRLLAYFSKIFVFLTAISGAFVAGLDAGLIYNTFPKMSNKWIPDDILFLTPILKNFTENPTTVQFNHRILAMITLFVISCMGVISQRYKLPARISAAVISVLTTACLQVSLGILTLCNYVPTHFAALHQSGSLIFLSTIVWLCHELKWIKKIAK